MLDITLQTTDTSDLFSEKALLDSGATGSFIDKDFVRRHHIKTRPLHRPIPVYNIDGTLNESGSISEVADFVLHYRDHTERTQFAVTSLGKQKVVLGFSWLRDHNPEVDWTTGEVKMSRCPARCRTCFVENQKEKKQRRFEEGRVKTCRAGPSPRTSLAEEAEEVEETVESPEVVMEEGDRLFACTLPPESEFLRASQTIL